MTDALQVVAGPRDTAQALVTMRHAGEFLRSAGLPILSIASHGVSFMPNAGYRIVLDDPGCVVFITARSPDRLATAIAAALTLHAKKLAAERDARADIRTSLADACIIAGLTVGRRFPDAARSIAGLPTIDIQGAGASFTGGKGSLVSPAGKATASWQRRAIRAGYDDDRVTYRDEVLTFRETMTMSEVLLAACVGRPVDRLVDFAPFRLQDIVVARAWMNVDGKGDERLKVRVKSASLGLHDAAKIIDRVHDLKRMGRIAA